MFISVCPLDKPDKYDPRDVERLQQDDNWVESYLCWRHDVVDETLKMIDESFQWRKEMAVNGKLFNLTLAVLSPVQMLLVYFYVTVYLQISLAIIINIRLQCIAQSH